MTRIIKLLIGAKDYKTGDGMRFLGGDIPKLLASTYMVPATMDPTSKDKDTVRDPATFLSIYMQTFFVQLSRDLEQYLRVSPGSRVDTDRLTHFRFDDRNDLLWDTDT